MTSSHIIGLTGGIATGKSTVADYLAESYGLPVFDADIYAREAVEPNSPIFTAIVQRYGSDILNDNGHLNRKRLGSIVFSNPEERHWLEKQIHPYVRSRFEQQRQTYPHQTLVFVIPLLFEAEMTDLVTQVWVVTCSPTQQQQRLINRSQLSTEEAQNRIKSQMPLAEKVKQADVVLDNSTTEEALFRQVDLALQRQSIID
jgi:dephospho-CoA kinase